MTPAEVAAVTGAFVVEWGKPREATRGIEAEQHDRRLRTIGS
ncbi:MAG TPA: hypothetical protein VK461_01495 [Acidimicrobiales bacterium]|nr:hypothetical protein [Acidimicrobiales bacterium]